MNSGNHTSRNFAPDGAGGGYAGVLPIDGGRDDAALAIRQTLDAARNHLLALRFALFNVAAFAMLGAAGAQGWISTVLSADDTGLSLGIFGVFLAGLGICAHRIWHVSMGLEQAQARRPDPASQAARYLEEVADRDSGSRATTAARLKLVLSGRIATVLHVANSLVLLGLVGTVVGFIIALSGVDPQSAGNVDSIAPMVAELIHGMSVALYTTLVGAVLHLWLKVNYLILSGGAVKLLDRLVARGEANARV
jgi:hypothetical protein